MTNHSNSHLTFLRDTRLCRLLPVLALFLFALQAYSQKSKLELEGEKSENLRRIAEAEKILSETESQKKVTIGQLTALNEQIRARESLISALSQEIGLLDGEISDLSLVIDALQSDLEHLKKEYAAMVYASYKSNQGFSFLTFLFAAETFNQLFKRLKYMEQYSEARKVQAEQILAVSESLNKQKSDVEVKREEQSALLGQQISENRKLVGLRSRKDELITELNKRGDQLRGEMAERKRAVERLDVLIAELIRAELERSDTKSSVTIANEEELSERFESSKKNLIWPVSSGFISSKFGKQPHPVLKRIVVDNTGIDIQTSEEAEVVSIFDGEVKTKAFVPGMNNVVIVKHGTYYTVYSKLKEVNVEKGQILSATDVIGKVHTDGEGLSVVHFEVWRNTQKLDPEKWLTD